jgi:hypothetical protein
MEVRTISVLMLVIAVYYIMAVATEIFVDDIIKPHSIFWYLLISTIITTVAALAINIEIPK